MLELKKIRKSYKTGSFTQHALKNVSIEFRKNEFVVILGASGSGKTTLLNIIGGLDRYDDGDLIINNKSTKKFKDIDWDRYRNNCIGFVFQSYNLIGHISLLDNVEMGMTLSGVSAKERRSKAKEALKRVGLIDHIHKKPNQLSGGQMQRVAIARALVNDPEVILADEPTGALDTKTSVQIMELIKEIAKDKLVIMVTHNPELANTYANRIIEFKDGEKISDSNPVEAKEKDNKQLRIRKTSMSLITALKLSFNNIKTKKGRTALTAFASSIGIIGIALILSLSNGFDIKIKEFERDTLSSLPIIVSKEAMNMDEKALESIQEENKKPKYPIEKEVYPKDSMAQTMTHTNIIDKEYTDYIKNIDQSLISGLSFVNTTGLNIITKNTSNNYIPVNSQFFGHIPEKPTTDNKYDFMESNYDLLVGNFPTKKEELVLIVDNKNGVDKQILSAIGLDASKESIDFNDLLDVELKLVPNDAYYKSFGHVYTVNPDFASSYNNKEAVTLKITGIIRGKEEKEMITSFSSGIGYSQELISYVIDTNQESSIVKAQEKVDYNIMTGEVFTENSETSKEQVLSYIGAESTPYVIQIFAKDFKTKEEVLDYLDKYNENKTDETKVVFTDMGDMIATMSGNIMDAITIVLIAFSSISLIVSSIMIGIITYISVLERTKEIGILRALGARKKDISRVFNAETLIIGTFSGLLGILIAQLLTIPTNAIIKSLTDLPNVAQLNPFHALILILVSILLTLIGGLIPARIASKKDPVDALRTE